MKKGKVMEAAVLLQEAREQGQIFFVQGERQNALEQFWSVLEDGGHPVTANPEVQEWFLECLDRECDLPEVYEALSSYELEPAEVEAEEPAEPAPEPVVAEAPAGEELPAVPEKVLRSQAKWLAQTPLGFVGLGLIPADGQGTLADDRGRIVYPATGMQAIVLDHMPARCRRVPQARGKGRAKDRDFRLGYLADLTAAHGVPTFSPERGSTLFDLHPEAEGEALDAKEYPRLRRVAQVCWEVMRSAALRHNPAWAKCPAAGERTVYYGNNQHERLPDAKDWLPKALYRMQRFSLADLHKGLTVQTDNGPTLTRDVLLALGRAIQTGMPIEAPVTGTYLGICGRRRGIKFHRIAVHHGFEATLAVPEDVVLDINSREFGAGSGRCRIPVTAGQVLGHAIHLPSFTAEMAKLRGSRKNRRPTAEDTSLDHYFAARKILGYEWLRHLEMLYLDQACNYVSEQRTVPWGLFQAAITREPERFTLYALDVTDSLEFVDEASEAICGAISRPHWPAAELNPGFRFRRSEDDRPGRLVDPGVGWRIALPAAADPYAAVHRRWPKAKAGKRPVRADNRVSAPAPKSKPCKGKGADSADKPRPVITPCDPPVIEADDADHPVEFLKLMGASPAMIKAQELITASTRRQNSAPTLLPDNCRHPKGKASVKKRVEAASTMKPIQSPLDEIIKEPKVKSKKQVRKDKATKRPVASHPLVSTITSLLGR